MVPNLVWVGTATNQVVPKPEVVSLPSQGSSGTEPNIETIIGLGPLPTNLHAVAPNPERDW